jgi:hypothetical protein
MLPHRGFFILVAKNHEEAMKPWCRFGEGAIAVTLIPTAQTLISGDVGGQSMCASS